MKLASFGNIEFDVLAVNSKTVEDTFSFARHETIIAPSSTEFLGTELQKINLKVQWHDQWCDDPKTEYENLVVLAKTGEEQQLIIATKYLGKYVIDKISVDEELTLPEGHTIFISCSIDLTEYVKKSIQTKKVTPKPAVKSTAVTTTPKPKQYREVRKKNTEVDGPNYNHFEEIK